MKNILKSLVFFILIYQGSVNAQVFYPVEARITQTPPYPLYLTDFSNPAQTNLSIQIKQNDASIASRSIRLKIYIEGQGFLIESTDIVQGEPPLMLNYGQIYYLSTAEVANYFKQYNLKVNPEQYRRPFSEGALRFGVQVIDFQTGRPLSGVQWGAPVWIFHNDPPVWVLPQNEAKVLPSSIPNIVFQWAPRHNNVSDVEYEFIMKELVFNSLSVGNIQNVFLSQPTFYSTKTNANTLVYNATMPPLIEGRIYAYRVRAIAKRGLEEVGIFKNNGFSEIQLLYYGEPMLPIKSPIITGLTRDELTNIAVLDWKGDTQHTLFTVAHREKGKNTNWTENKVEPIINSTLNSFTFTQLDPAKSYEIRVGAQDRYNQSAFSESVFLDSLSAERAIEVQISGKVMWAFAENEQNISYSSPLTTEQGTPHRTIDRLQTSTKTSKQHYLLGNASISLIQSDADNITVENLDKSQYELLKKISANNTGEFKLLTDNLKLLSGLKNIYLIAEYDKEPFDKVVMKIGENGRYKANIDLGEIVLMARSIRFSPRLITSVKQFEEVGLYRLNSVINQNPFLANEGNITGAKPTAIYNSQSYQKIADFGLNTSSGAIFANSHFNDQFILKIKEKNRKEIFIPIEEISSSTDNSTLKITDYLAYTSVPYKLEGQVTKGKVAVNQAIVQAFGQTTYTDETGFYSFDIPETISASTAFSVKVKDPLNANNFIQENLVFNENNIQKDFELSNKAYYIESQVIDSDNKPVAGATVIIGKDILKSDKNGWYSFTGNVSNLPAEVQILLDGFNEIKLPLSQFLRTPLQAANELNSFKTLAKNPALIDKDAYYTQNFVQIGVVCSEIYTSAPLKLTKTYNYRIITFKEKTSTLLNFVNLADYAEFIAADIKVDDSIVSVPKGSANINSGDEIRGIGGFTGVAKQPFIKVQTFNASNKPIVVEEEMILTIPESASINDTTTFLVQIKEGVYFNGIVQDSTIYIEGLHVPGTVKKAGEKLNFIAGATVEVLGGGKTTTDEQGKFRMPVPVGKDLAFSIAKSGYITSTTYIRAAESNDYKSSSKYFYLKQLDTTTIPVIKTLMGFDVIVDKLVVHSSEVTNDKTAEEIINKGNRTYKLSGKIIIAPDGENSYKVSKVTNLKFNDILIRMESKDSENAILVYNSANLTETQLKVLLFGYAPITVSSDPANAPYIRLMPMKGHKGHGVIGGSSMVFTQSTMAGLNFGKMKLQESEEDEYSFGQFSNEVSEDKQKELGKIEEDEEEEEATKPSSNGFKLTFASQALASLSEDKEFKILFDSKASKATLAKEGIDSTSGPYYRAPFAATNISGIYSAMNVYVNHETATLTKDGISLDGYFGLPKIWKFKNEGALEIKSLVINTKFNLEELEIGKNPNSKKGEITKFSVGSKWVMYINTFIVTNNFKGFGFSGTFNMDKENYLNINSFTLASIDGEYYPSVKLSTSEKGLVFKNIKFTTLKNSTISFSRNPEEEDYEVDAAFKLEYVSNGSSNAALERLAKKIFPLTVQRFLWSTSGKLLIAIAPENSIEVGPLKVNVRRILYTKGGATTKNEINKLLALTQEEGDKLSSTTAFNDANTKVVNGKKVGVFSKEEREARDAISSDALFVKSLAEEVAELDPAAKWAFAFAGGIQVISSSVKGMNFDSDLSFLVGDFGSGVEFQLNEIMIKLDAPAFRVLGKVKIETGDERIGFEGTVDVETVKQKFAGAFKFYQIYYISSGNKKGIELGASILAKTKLPMGSITWTSIGGGFDLNTANSTYKFFFMGSATNTGVSEKLTEYRDINVSVEFNTKECDGYPVIKGSMALYINNASFCKGSIEFDFCKIRVIGKIDCQRELVTGISGKLNAVLVGSKQGFLTGCTVQIKVLGFTQNASFALGIHFNTTSSLAQEVSSYVSELPSYLKHSDNVTFTGVYFKFKEQQSFKSSGKVSVETFDLVGYSLDIERNFEVHMGVNFINGNFEIRSGEIKTNPVYLVIALPNGQKVKSLLYTWKSPNIAFKCRVEVLGYGITGILNAAADFAGGRNNSVGWHIAANFSAEIQVYNDTGADFDCNRVNVKWSKNKVMVYPCGIKCSARWDFWNACSVKWCDVNVSLPNFKDGIGIKVCISGSFGVSYQEKGSQSGWRFKL